MSKIQYLTPSTSVFELRPENSLLSLSDGTGAKAPNVETMESGDIYSGAEW